MALIPACFGGEREMTGECPAGETCSNLTPNGLYFVGADMADTIELVGPSPTAIGGTQDVKLQYEGADSFIRDLDFPYIAEDDGGIGVKVDHHAGSVVSLVGVGSRSNYLRISDADTGTLFDRKMLAGAAIDSMKLVPTSGETIPADLDVAFWHGNVELGVALYGSVQEDTGPETERLVDQSMQLSLAGGSQHAWDSAALPAAAAGTYSLAVTAGNRPTANLDVIVVDHIDSIAIDPISDSTIAPHGSALVCFDAITAGRFVAEVPWSITIDGVQQSPSSNCTVVQTTLAAGTISVYGSAGFMTTVATLTIGVARTTSPGHASRHNLRLPSPDGDRRAM